MKFIAVAVAFFYYGVSTTTAAEVGLRGELNERRYLAPQEVQILPGLTLRDEVSPYNNPYRNAIIQSLQARISGDASCGSSTFSRYFDKLLVNLSPEELDYALVLYTSFVGDAALHNALFSDPTKTSDTYNTIFADLQSFWDVKVKPIGLTFPSGNFYKNTDLVAQTLEWLYLDYAGNIDLATEVAKFVQEVFGKYPKIGYDFPLWTLNTQSFWRKPCCAGNDVIVGGGGDKAAAVPGGGNDVIYGGDQDFVLLGGGGNDVIYGGGHDRVVQAIVLGAAAPAVVPDDAVAAFVLGHEFGHYLGGVRRTGHELGHYLGGINRTGHEFGHGLGFKATGHEFGHGLGFKVTGHEFGHGLGFKRREELLAVAFGAYYAHSPRGASLETGLIKTIVEATHGIGDCDVDGTERFGTPNQRARAVEFATNLVDTSKDKSYIVPPETFVALFDKALPGIIDPTSA